MVYSFTVIFSRDFKQPIRVRDDQRRADSAKIRCYPQTPSVYFKVFWSTSKGANDTPLCLTIGAIDATAIYPHCHVSPEPHFDDLGKAISIRILRRTPVY